MHSNGGVVMCVWRYVLGHHSAHPMNKSWISKQMFILRMNGKERIFLKIILTLCRVLTSLHSAGHWHCCIQIWCTNRRERNITTELIDRRFRWRLCHRIQFLDFILFRDIGFWRRKVADVIVFTRLLRPRESQRCFLLKRKLQTLISLLEDAIQNVGLLRCEHVVYLFIISTGKQ